MALQFAPFASDIELPFYTSLASHKINHDKLDDSARKVLGLYEIRPNDAPEASCRMQILGNALTSNELVFLLLLQTSPDSYADLVVICRSVPKAHCRAEGIIKNVNTIEEYRNLDKNAILHRAGSTVSTFRWHLRKLERLRYRRYGKPSLTAQYMNALRY